MIYTVSVFVVLFQLTKLLIKQKDWLCHNNNLSYSYNYTIKLLLFFWSPVEVAC